MTEARAERATVAGGWGGLGEVGRAATPRAALRSLGGALARVAAFILLFSAVLLLLMAGIMSADAADASLGVIFLSSALMLVAALGAGAALIRWIDHRSVGALGIALTERTGREVGIGLAIGAGALVVAVLLSLAAGLGYRGQDGTLVGWLGLVAGTFVGFATAVHLGWNWSMASLF
ncbi:MAG: hypothetical protein WEA24_16060, partial [Gemmatimonadota bacterium]